MRGADTALDLAELAGGGGVEVWAEPGQPPPSPQLCLRGPGRVRSPVRPLRTRAPTWRAPRKPSPELRAGSSL